LQETHFEVVSHENVNLKICQNCFSHTEKYVLITCKTLNFDCVIYYSFRNVVHLLYIESLVTALVSFSVSCLCNLNLHSLFFWKSNAVGKALASRFRGPGLNPQLEPTLFVLVFLSTLNIIVRLKKGVNFHLQTY